MKILFVGVILLFMGVVVEYTIIVYIDNVGSILLSVNTLVSQLTKHIDVRHHFIRECVGNRIVKNLIISFRRKPGIYIYKEPKQWTVLISHIKVHTP